MWSLAVEDFGAEQEERQGSEEDGKDGESSEDPADDDGGKGEPATLLSVLLDLSHGDVAEDGADERNEDRKDQSDNGENVGLATGRLRLTVRHR